MELDRLRALLREVKGGNLPIEEALDHLRKLPFSDLGFAKVDHHRPLRNGYPEVIYCPGKSPEQVAAIAQDLAEGGGVVLATRAGQEAWEALEGALGPVEYYPRARLAVLNRPAKTSLIGHVAVVSAGTSDEPVAEEAALTLEIFGSRTDRIYDVGVAGLPRLLEHHPRLREARVIVVVAGMEGALPSVIGGLVDRPVIAVPTSVGYGANFGGLAALLSMLNSCAPGVSVVNIDNGFGAAIQADMINRLGPP